jgi:hypothetical protein
LAGELRTLLSPPKPNPNPKPEADFFSRRPALGASALGAGSSALAAGACVLVTIAHQPISMCLVHASYAKG